MSAEEARNWTDRRTIPDNRGRPWAARAWGSERLRSWRWRSPFREPRSKCDVAPGIGRRL